MKCYLNDSFEKKEKNNQKVEKLGLSTRDALKILQRDIQNTIEDYLKNCKKNKKYKEWVKDALHHKSQHTTFCWTSAAALLISALMLIVPFFIGNKSEYSNWPIESIIIIIIVVFNCTIVIFDNRLRHFEILHKTKNIIQQIEVAKLNSLWKLENYPHLCTPVSPCITLQWTYRDGEIVNLPCSLLVAGDIIVIKPGQQAPGYCIPYNDTNASALHAHEFYNPKTNNGSDVFSTPQMRIPFSNKIYELQETPYLVNLRMALNMSLDRPVTFHNRERHIFMIFGIQHIAYPILFVLLLMFNLMRYLYLHKYTGLGPWTELFISQPVTVALPLLPIAFPIWWIAMNCFGMARFKALYKLYQSSNKVEFLDPFEENTYRNHPDVVFNWSELSTYFWDIMLGKEHMMTRSANILHVLGSVTALCCVDKKGVLSWPNPTAEKIFFLRSAKTKLSTCPLSRTSSMVHFSNLKDPVHPSSFSLENQNSSRTSCKENAISHAVVEVLDLTHDRLLPFKLQFDDQTWRQYMNSLKPLGLAILLNTCNMKTQDQYMQFCCHMACEVERNKNLVPVINRRCLCELATQIGFKDQAREKFHLEKQLFTFRHVMETPECDIKFVRSLSMSTKVKFPFPHMMAVILKENHSDNLQLFSQGTADIILDSCIEFWDGHDICYLTEADKKKVNDFYNRTSLTSYCTAFAYRPLTYNLLYKYHDAYLEYPAEPKNLNAYRRQSTSLLWNLNIPDARTDELLEEFHSSDSFLYNNIEHDEMNHRDMYSEGQSKQIFIGMVTMQYQAQNDMVRLIEQLEHACIRFVYFSKENELRSRVFSEKMGLESGWNCHISLLSEHVSPNFVDSESKSISTPSVINTEIFKMKTRNEKSIINAVWNHNSVALDKLQVCNNSENEREQATSSNKNNIWVQNIDLDSGQDAWRSLSCLTDTTEQSAPINFDLSNRAKLPRGIDKIRPHLAQIDNVPLLVSLFTDCNTAVTKEMLFIMQEYGEIVCVLGSSANTQNMTIFLQADVAVAVEPLYPQICQRIPVLMGSRTNQGPSPIDLSQNLNSVACSLSIKREEPIAIYQLIMEARHYMKCLWNCVQFWLCCLMTLSIIQALSAFLLLPPLFNIGQILWLCIFTVPMISVSLIGTPTDPSIMQHAIGKNQCIISRQMAAFILWCYGSKFLPTIITVVLWQCVSLFVLCSNYTTSNSECFYIYPDIASELSWGGWGGNPELLDAVNQIALLITIVHFVTISISFVHREYSIWKKLPFNNWIWFLNALLMICLQVAYSESIFRNYWRPEDKKVKMFSLKVPLYFFISVPLIFAINEFVKWQEIKINIRYQKRARLEFTTKLGMNSPF